MSQLVLASQSPRRIQLLEKAGFSFTPITLSTSELIDEKLHPDAQILSITRLKLEAAEKHLASLSQGSATVIVADTEVLFEGRHLGKPQNKEHSHEIIRRLSGNAHFVKTGVIIKNLKTQKEVSHIESSLVQFRQLTDIEIDNYVNTGEGMDKAGAYGIQGLGQRLVAFQRGSMNNIIGLPIEFIAPILKTEFNFSVKS